MDLSPQNGLQLWPPCRHTQLFSLPLHPCLHVRNRGVHCVVFYISFQIQLYHRLSKDYPPPRQRSIRGLWQPTLRAVLGMTLAVGPTVASTSTSRATSTAGSGASLQSTPASQSLYITLKGFGSV